MSDIVERLKDNSTLVICPFDRKSPEYWSTPNDQPCKFCGGEPDGPDKCTGADTRIMGEAANEITALRSELASLKAMCDEMAKALEPFSEMAGEMFARNWNAGEAAIALDNPDGSHRVTAGDFFAVRRTVSAYRKEKEVGNG